MPLVATCLSPTHLQDVSYDNMQSERYFAEISLGAFIQRTRVLPYCKSCWGRSSNKGQEALRAELARLRREFYFALGGELRKCQSCSNLLPTAFFSWVRGKVRPSEAPVPMQKRVCYDCLVKRPTRAAREALEDRSPFATTMRAISARCGREVQQWTQREHEHQVVLMRDLAGLKQHRTPDDSASVITQDHDAAQEAIWERRLQRTKDWLGESLTNTVYAQTVRVPLTIASTERALSATLSNNALSASNSALSTSLAA